MICPNCNIEMGSTYDPYEYRCTQCGYWFDTWTGKEVQLEVVPVIIDVEDASLYDFTPNTCPDHNWELIWDDGDRDCRVCMYCGEERIFEHKE